MYLRKEICQKTVYKMIEREVERNEADSRESGDVKLNVKAPSDPHFQLAEVLAHIAVVLAHLAQ